MNEKLVAGIVTAALISPICAVCIIGPAAIGSLFAGLFGYLGGFGPLATIALMIAAGALVYRHFLRKKIRMPPGRIGPSDVEFLATQTNIGRSQVPDSRSNPAKTDITDMHFRGRKMG